MNKNLSLNYMDTTSIHFNIRKARLRSGLSQEELASKIGMSRQAYYNLESGCTKLIHAKLEHIAKECGTTLENILLGESDLGTK